MKKAVILSFLLCLLISCTETEKKEEVWAVKKINVASVNYPLQYFAEIIGGKYVNSQFPAPNDEDPAYWQPTVKEIVLYQSADIILLNGASYAKWIDKISLPESKKINTSSSIKEKYVNISKGVSHSHGLGGEHEHKGYAFTTWLNFEIAKVQAEAVKNVLVQKLPENKKSIDANFSELSNDLDSLNLSMQKVAEKFKGKTLFASHPVYQYLGSAYNLKIISEHWEPNEEPTEKNWKHFKSKLKKNPSTIMLWEAEPLPSIRVELEKLGIQVVIFNPCGNTPADGDFISVMKLNINKFHSVL